MRVSASILIEGGHRIGWSIASVDGDHRVEIVDDEFTFSFLQGYRRGISTFTSRQVDDLGRLANLLPQLRADLARDEWHWESCDADVDCDAPFSVDDIDSGRSYDGFVENFAVLQGDGRVRALGLLMPTGLHCLVDWRRIIVGTPWAVEDVRKYVRYGRGPNKTCSWVDEDQLAFMAEVALIVRGTVLAS